MPSALIALDILAFCGGIQVLWLDNNIQKMLSLSAHPELQL